MIVMFTHGIGMSLGSRVSGALYSRLVVGQTVPQAWIISWWILTVTTAVVAVIFPFLFKYDDKEQA